MIGKGLYKKGNVVIDTFIILVMVVGVSIALLFIVNSAKDITSEIINENVSGISVNNSAPVKDLQDNYPGWLDFLIISIAIFLWIGALIASAFIDSHPLFFGIALIFVVIFCIVGGFLSNTWEELASDSDVTDISDQLTMSNFFFSKLPIYIILVALSIGFVLYAKYKIQ